MTVDVRPADRETEHEAFASECDRSDGRPAAVVERDVGLARPRHQARGRRLARVPLALLATDVLALAAAWTSADVTAPWGALVVGLFVPLYAALGLYRTRLTLSVLDDLPRLVGGAALATVATTSLQGLTHHSSLPATYLAGAVAAGLVLGARTVAYAVIREVRRRGLVTYRTLVVGADRLGADVWGKIRRHPEFGLRAAGFVDVNRLARESPRTSSSGHHRELLRIVRGLDASVVIVAFEGPRADELVDVLRSIPDVECDLFVVSRLFEVQTQVRADRLRSVPLVRLHRGAALTKLWRIKRACDLVLASVALVLLAPVLAVTALAVRRETGAGVLFRQQRIGLHGRPFTMLKFRSYRPTDTGEAETRWSLDGAVALGSVGRFIRRTSLDELPQLVNVLRGEMSLVGPRPERPHFVKVFSSEVPAYQARHRVPAGLTGWAAVHGLRGDTSVEERVHFDNAYIDHWSLWLDVKIIMRTFSQVLRGSGA